MPSNSWTTERDDYLAIAARNAGPTVIKTQADANLFTVAIERTRLFKSHWLDLLSAGPLSLRDMGGVFVAVDKTLCPSFRIKIPNHPFV